MSRERWGTFSVRDHLMPRAFVADVLLYDRLVIPCPPNEEERKRWFCMGWQPDNLEKNLELLGDTALQVPWDQYRQEEYDIRLKLSRAVSFDTKNIAQAINSNTDPYYMTRQVLSQEALPILPAGVSKVWALAAYPSIKKYEEDKVHTKQELKEQLAFVLANKFLVPEDSQMSDAALLKEAVKLAERDDFRQKRENLHRWQESIIEENIPIDKAMEEMEDYLTEYNGAIKKAKVKMAWKVSFLALEVALGLAGAAFGEFKATVGALAGITKFVLFDRKLEIDSGDFTQAAMIHSAQKSLKWKDN